MTYEQVLDELKKKIYRPIYFFMGEEPYFMDVVSDFIATNVLTEAEKSFNQTIAYGKDTDATAITMMARRFPMMANHQVIIVKEAQNVKDIENLIHYAEKPLSSTILVINYKYKTLDKRKKLFTVLNKADAVMESNKLYDDKIPDWVSSYLRSKGFGIDPAGSRLLADSVGNDLSRMAMECDKLILTLPVGEKAVTTSHIERNIGISKEYNNFELQNALVQKNALKANQIINYFASNPNANPLPATLAVLFSFFVKTLKYHALKDKSPRTAAAALGVNPYFIKDYEQAARKFPIEKVVQIIGMLREYDLKSKGVDNATATDGDLLRELVFKIIH